MTRRWVGNGLLRGLKSTATIGRPLRGPGPGTMVAPRQFGLSSLGAVSGNGPAQFFQEGRFGIREILSR
jgi:hypothetical protein